MSGAGKPIYIADYPSFSPADRLALADLVARVGRPGARVAEIGSWLGQGSTRVFIDTLAPWEGSSLLCVDTWRGSPGVIRHQELVRDFDVFATFQANVAEANGVSVLPFMAGSLDAAAHVADSFFDLVFIDADHSYESVRADIAAWLPKVRPGGILCGHDCELRVTDELRPHLTAHRSVDAISLAGTQFAVVHPGSVLAVDETLGADVMLFAERPGPLGPSSIWYLQAARR